MKYFDVSNMGIAAVTSHQNGKKHSSYNEVNLKQSAYFTQFCTPNTSKAEEIPKKNKP